MDASEIDRDVLLQKSSAELLADLETSLEPFLWKTPSSGNPRIRRRVRAREADRLVGLVERFQELPQLLDPHLNTLVPVLAQAFLSYLQTVPRPKHATGDTELLITLSKAICRLLYTFCKVRGEKVIVRFLSTETRHLELLLSAIEHGNPLSGGVTKTVWSWEERYITLLWLSQLLLAPFDLATISSSDSEDDNIPIIPHLKWPSKVPGISLRVIPLAIRYLSSPGKERDAARFLLVRIAMRRDMQDLGMLKVLVEWAIASFGKSEEPKPVYHYIGVLSFLAGILNSSIGTSDMAPYVPKVFRLIEDISEAENTIFHGLQESAVARKIIIKIIRTISVLDLRTEDMTRAESTIGTLLEYLSHSSTPVRLAASKSLSMITMKLDTINPEFATQIVEAVLEELERSITWVKVSAENETSFDLSRADPSQWHGLILTLAHLLYRHSVHAEQLPSLLSYLAVGLAFQKKSTTGGRLGTNVRDAACFGIWALARRYSTAELINVKINIASLSGAVQEGTPFPDNTNHIPSLDRPDHESERPVLQRLATELVISASLDPEGNIRRGASAALQELVGRHPDIIVEGIKLVQVVDYHAVARRSRAIQEVATQAAQLSDNYYDGLRIALLGWRGAADGDAFIRRTVASTFADVVWDTGILSRHASLYSILSVMLHSLGLKIRNLGSRQREVDETHGLLLCLACCAQKLRTILNPGTVRDDSDSENAARVSTLVASFTELSLEAMKSVEESFGGSSTRQELLAESLSCLISAINPCVTRQAILQHFRAEFESSVASAGLPETIDLNAQEGEITILCDTMSKPTWMTSTSIYTMLKTLQRVYIEPTFVTNNLTKFSKSAQDLLSRFMDTTEESTISSVSDAAFGLLLLASPTHQASTILEWIQVAKGKAESGRKGQGKAYIHTFFKMFQLVEYEDLKNFPLQEKIIQALNWRWNLSYDLEIRTTILSCLSKSNALMTQTKDFEQMILAGLEDYTTDSRGDIGSHVRIEATKVVGILFQQPEPWKSNHNALLRNLIGKIFRLGAEKLDKVRIEAQVAISHALNGSQRTEFLATPPTSQQYFFTLLALPESYGLDNSPQDPTWLLSLLEGFVLSADTGSQDLIRVSRAALIRFCSLSPSHLQFVCSSLVLVLEQNLANDRVLVSVLEVIGFLFDMQIFQQADVKWSRLFFLVQKAHFKTGNVRKLEGAVRVYAGFLEIPSINGEVEKKLRGMLRHNFPRVRKCVEEELFVGLGENVEVGVKT
ncbi:tubulin folding cofactor D C terminal-domain-containing protein [Halenospora varia]|nr:tubulin folding cofactor D C terminal-domain-containing protein [Halenospora varia]